VQEMSIKMRQIEWRRRQVFELSSKGQSHIKKYIDERLPEEYEKCLVGLTAITKEAWNTAQSTEDKREKIQALPLAKECYSMKLELLTNATVVDYAIRFASSNGSKNNQKSFSSNEDHKELNEPDYGEDQDQLEEEQEEEAGETITAITTNKVF
jgi:hypothetical protein